MVPNIHPLCGPYKGRTQDRILKALLARLDGEQYRCGFSYLLDFFILGCLAGSAIVHKSSAVCP